MSSSSAYDHAAVTINITCNNMPPNLIAVLCGEIGAQLGLQWSRGLVTSDYTDGDAGFHTGFFSRGGTFVCRKVDQLRP